MGVVLVGFAMFLAYLYSQGKIQAVWSAAFGAPATVVADNSTTGNQTSGAVSNTTQSSNPVVVGVVAGSVADTTGQVAVTPEAYTSGSLSFPQVSVN